MQKIGIIGAGDVGATLAYTLQVSGTATEIVLVDVNRGIAEGNVLDMNHGLFFTKPVKVRVGDYPDCSDSTLVIVTAGARQREGESRLDLTRRNADIVESIISNLKPFLGTATILVISNPVDVMTRVAWCASDLPKSRVFGSGTVLDSARFRYELSRWCEVDPRNVHAYVVGEHGDSEVFLWSRVHIAGIPLHDFCRSCDKRCDSRGKEAVERKVRESAYHIIEAKGFTNYGVSLAVRRIVGALLRDEKSVLTVSTAMEGEYGLRDVCLSVPCVVGSNGVERIIETDLSEEERAGLDTSADTLRYAYCSLNPVCRRKGGG